jgi:HTH-type transcriptional regulator / antitoxin HipB
MTTSRTLDEIIAERSDEPGFQQAYREAQLVFQLGLKLRQLRLDKGLSQSELARRAATSQAAIARLEAGATNPRMETLQRVGAALGFELVVDFRGPAAA